MNVEKPFFFSVHPLFRIIEMLKVVFIGYSSHQTNQIPSPRAEQLDLMHDSNFRIQTEDEKKTTRERTRYILNFMYRIHDENLLVQIKTH